jgi:hypothetical protein
MKNENIILVDPKYLKDLDDIENWTAKRPKNIQERLQKKLKNDNLLLEQRVKNLEKEIKDLKKNVNNRSIYKQIQQLKSDIHDSNNRQTNVSKSIPNTTE